MAELFVVRSIVLSSPVAIISSVSGSAKKFYCATCFHSSTRCSPDRLHPWNLRFSSLVYLFSVFLYLYPLFLFARPVLPSQPRLLSRRDKPMLPFAAHPPIIPNTENTVWNVIITAVYLKRNRPPFWPFTSRHVVSRDCQLRELPLKVI